MNDEEIENLILSGEAIPAEKWMSEDLTRRIGESIFDKDHANRNIETRKAQGVDLWFHQIKKDTNGLLYASVVIYKLPKVKSRKKNIIKGINLAQILAGLPPFDISDEKYLYVILPSAEQVKNAINTMKSTWGK